MYKGFKTERAFYNCKLHGLAVVITTEENANDFLKEEVVKILKLREYPCNLFSKESSSSGVKELSDIEAKTLYFRLLKVAQNMKANVKSAREITGTPGNEITDDQRKYIIKICKYQFKWSAQVTFSKIIEICPELNKRLTPWQIQNTKIGVLYNILSKAQAHKIIKQLLQIEKRNKEKQT